MILGKGALGAGFGGGGFPGAVFGSRKVLQQLQQISNCLCSWRRFVMSLVDKKVRV
jgi:hypothetical protein